MTMILSSACLERVKIFNSIVMTYNHLLTIAFCKLFHPSSGSGWYLEMAHIWSESFLLIDLIEGRYSKSTLCKTWGRAELLNGISIYTTKGVLTSPFSIYQAPGLLWCRIFNAFDAERYADEARQQPWMILRPTMWSFHVTISMGVSISIDVREYKTAHRIHY